RQSRYAKQELAQKRVQVQMSIYEELAQKVHEKEQARFNAEHEAKFNAEQEQERLDHETAMKIQEELDAAERQGMAQVHQATQGFTDDEWDDILARVATERYFVKQLQAGEKVSDEDLPRKLVELNQEGGYTLKQLKALSFEEVKKIFEATMRKQTGKEPKAEELSQEQLHQMMMMVIPVEEVYVEALQVKYLTIDREIYSEDLRKYWKIIRVGGHTEAYQTFDDMLKKFNRDDLDKLWNLVKERFITTEPTEDKVRELWVELKRLFEPDDNDTLYIGHDIYMLVEKDYPLTKAFMTLMLCNKLRVDQYSDMAEELLKKIFILVERSRHLGEDCWELNVYTLSLAKLILNTTQDITNSTNQLVLQEEKVMEFESAQSNTTAKLSILKLENSNSWVSVPQTTQENGTSVTKMSVPVTAEEKTNKKNDVKARSLLLMALPNEHQLTFSQYIDCLFLHAL
ncbi:hypothetical protein Tco_1415239, partial [Tanacetum coccineum]